MIKTRRIISLTLVMAMLIQMFSFATFAVSPEDFVDFPNNWSTEAMTAAVENGLLEGTSDTTIEPNKNLTRAEFAAIVTRAFRATTKADVSHFEDVTADDWFNESVERAVKMQVLEGTGSTTFHPKDSMRREDVFLALSRVLFVSEDDFSYLDVFTDKNEIDVWAKEGVSGMTAKQYINGYGNGLLMPRGTITRAELAQFFHNLFKQYISEPGEYTSVVEQGSVVIRSRDVVLRDVTINGDLVIADGVGDGNLTVSNVHVKGRILVRGGEGVVTFKNVTADDKVIINDVNGVVNFHNYRDEAPFKDNLIENTPATFLKRMGGTGGSGGGGGGTTEKFDVVFKNSDGTELKKLNDVVKNYKLKLADIPDDDKVTVPYGMNFVGWAEDATATTGTSKANLIGTLITKDTTFYPIFTDKERYTITFVNPDDASNPYKFVDNVISGSKLVAEYIPDDPAAPAGMYFAGWSVSSTATAGFTKEQLVAQQIEVTSNLVYYPVFVDKDSVVYYIDIYVENIEDDDFGTEVYVSVPASGRPGTTAKVTADDIANNPDVNLTGFEFDATASNVLSAVIPESGDMHILEMYYKRLRLTLNQYDPVEDDANPYHTVQVKYGATASLYEDKARNLIPVENGTYIHDVLSEKGYFKNKNLIGYNDSDVYTDENFVHQIPYSWWYLDNGEYVKFTEDFVFTEDIDIYVKIKKLYLTVEVPKIGEIYLYVYYDEDTRLADTIKDGLFINESTFTDAVDVSGAEEKLYSKIAEKGFMSEDDYEIMNINKFVRFARLMGEENFKEFLSGFYQEGEGKLEDHLYEYIITTETNETAGHLQKLILDLYKQEPVLVEDMLSQVGAHLIAENDAFVKEFFIKYAKTHVDANDTDDLEEMVSDMLGDYKTKKPNEFKAFVVDLVIKAIKNGDTNVIGMIRDYIKSEVRKGTFDEDIIKHIVDMSDDDFKKAAKDIIEEDISIIEGNVKEKLETDSSFMDSVIDEIFDLNSAKVDNEIKSYIKDYYLDDYIESNPEKLVPYISDEKICEIAGIAPGTTFTDNEKLDAIEEFLDTETNAVAKLKEYAGNTNINKIIGDYLTNDRDVVKAKLKDSVANKPTIKNEVVTFAMDLIGDDEYSDLLDFAVDKYLGEIVDDVDERRKLATAEVDRLQNDKVYNLPIVQDAINDCIDDIIDDIATGSTAYNSDIATYAMSISDYTKIVHSFLYTDDDTREEAIGDLVDDVYALEDDHATLLSGMNTMTHGMLEKDKIDIEILVTIVDYIKKKDAEEKNGNDENQQVGGIVIDGHTLVHDIVDKLMEFDGILDFAEANFGWADPSGKLAASKKFEKEATYDESFEVTPDNLFIMEKVREKVALMTLDSFLDEYVYPRIPDRVPQSLIDKLPWDIVETIYDRAINDFIAELDVAVALAKNNGESSYVHSGVFVQANPFDDVALPLYEDYLLPGYDKANEKAQSLGGRVGEIYLAYYKDNPYIDDVVNLSSPELYINGTGTHYKEPFSGYTIAGFDEIYRDVVKPSAVLSDDLFLWYIERVEFSKIRGLVEDNEELILALVNHPNVLLARYAEEGLPEDMIDYYNDLLENDEIREAVEKIDNKVSFEMQPFVERVLLNNTVDMYYYKALERAGVKAEEMLGKYASADFKKDYTHEDVVRILDETEYLWEDGNKNGTTDYFFDKAPGDDDVFDATFRGYDVTLERMHSDD